jgi:transposase-like protein
MNCKRCKVKMAETRGTHHKQKKWQCPVCGRARMEAVARKRRPRERRPDARTAED